MPGMHAPLHRIAAAIAIAGIVVGIVVIIVAVVGVRVAWSECKCAERKSARVVETAAAETIGCEGSTAKSTAPNSG